MKLAAIAIALFQFAVLVPAFAQPPSAIAVHQGMPLSSIDSEYIQVIEDAKRQFTLTDIKSGTPPTSAYLSNAQGLSYGFTDSAFWVVFSLSNSESSNAKLLLEQDYPLIDSLDVWYGREGADWQHWATGDHLPFSSRPIENNTFMFPLVVPAYTDVTVIMRFQSQGAVNIGLRIGAYDSYFEDMNHRAMVDGAYYGGIITLALYNLILFISIRERTYLLYIAYISCFGLLMSILSGLSFQYLWPNSPAFANRSLLSSLGAGLIFALTFSRRICSLKSYFPRLDLFARGVTWVAAGALIVTQFVPYASAAAPWSLFTLSCCVLMLIFGTLCTWRGDVASRYFMLGWSAVMFAIIFYFLKDFGLLPHTPLSDNALLIGALLDMTLMSIALGARYTEAQRVGYADSLSSLGNRRQFNERVPIEFKAAAKTHQPLSLILIDIDHFKQVNDTWGHAEGDEVLRSVGKILGANTRKPNFACRYGGEEFSIILSDTTLSEAGAVAERLRAIIENTRINEISVTASFGVACTDMPSIDSVEELIRAADQAMYAAKSAGRNCVRVHCHDGGGRELPVAPEKEYSI